MSFKEYCIDKKIDPKLFFAGNADLFQEMKRAFDQMHPKSFTMQYLFVINDIRRQYLLEVSSETQESKPKTTIKPKVKIPGKPSIPKATSSAKVKIPSKKAEPTSEEHHLEEAKPKPKMSPKVKIPVRKPAVDKTGDTEEDKSTVKAKPKIPLKVKIPPRKKD